MRSWLLATLVVATVVATSSHDHGVASLSSGDDVGQGAEAAKMRQDAVRKIEDMISPDPGLGEGSETRLPKAVMDHLNSLEDQVAELKDAGHTIVETTKMQMRSRLNNRKEKYYKRMKKSTQYRDKMKKIVDRATRAITAQTIRAGKYRAINKVLAEKAGYAASLKQSLDDMTGKLHTTIQVTETLTQKAAKDATTIHDLSAKVAALQAKQGLHHESDKHLTLEQQIKKQKKLAQAAHSKASELHNQAAAAHDAEGFKDSAAEAKAMAQKSLSAAEADNLKVDDEGTADVEAQDEDAADADEKKAEDEEEEAKALIKKAKKAKKKAKKEAKAAKKVAKAKKKAEKLQEEADKAKEEAAGAGDDDDDSGDDQ